MSEFDNIVFPEHEPLTFENLKRVLEVADDCKSAFLNRTNYPNNNHEEKEKLRDLFRSYVEKHVFDEFNNLSYEDKENVKRFLNIYLVVSFTDLLKLRDEV